MANLHQGGLNNDWRLYEVSYGHGKAILIRNGVEPVNISESSKLSLKQPLTELKFSLYLRTEHLSHFLPGYVYSIKECPLSYDIGIEIQKIFESLHLLNEEFESLGFVSVWIEMHQSIFEQSRFKKSNFTGDAANLLI